ncbi:hypothetical protein QBC44DRAFT_332887 [Cladorrhinum sp. PSN332]|nr:hypothetical protein QBC44DRAFT_332887 [Cladorrhinum sp. PSN332]
MIHVRLRITGAFSSFFFLFFFRVFLSWLPGAEKVLPCAFGVKERNRERSASDQMTIWGLHYLLWHRLDDGAVICLPG